MERNQVQNDDLPDRKLRAVYTAPGAHDRFLDFFSIQVRADFDPAVEALQALER